MAPPFRLIGHYLLHLKIRPRSLSFFSVIKLKQNVRCSSSASIYVHWPYCRKRCTYCNFNKYISSSVDNDRMEACLTKEVKTLISYAGVENISSIFFGGGTPSLARPSTIAAVFEAVASAAVVDKNAEVSMEVNPTALQADRLRDFKSAGINRVSVGVQTLSTPGLKVLGRDHSVEESLRCLDAAQDLFRGNVSLDLIFGWPGQDINMWKQEIEQIVPLSDNHLSLYQLTLEQGTPLYKQVKSGLLTVADESLSEDMYLHAVEFLQKKGFERYEVSNFARESRYSRHNMSYWNGGQYIGVGPGAHGRFQCKGSASREARVQTLVPDSWMKEVEEKGHGTRLVRPLSSQDRQEELLVTGLRTKWGISHEAWLTTNPEKSLSELVDHSDVLPYLENGLLIYDSSGIRATPQGINIIDTIVVSLLDALKDQQCRGLEKT